MEQETLVTRLTETIGETNLSERTISEYAKSIMPMITTDEMVNDAFLETHGNILKTIGGQLRHDLADGIEKFKKDYKPETEKQKPKQQPSGDDKYEALMAEIKNLKENIAEKDKVAAKNATKEKVISTLREKIKEATGSKPNEFVFKNTIRDIEIGDDADFSKLVKDAQKAYDENLKEAGITAETPRYGQQNRNGEKTALDDFFAKKAAKEGWGKK